MNNGVLDRFKYDDSEMPLDKEFIKSLGQLGVNEWINKIFNEKTWESLSSSITDDGNSKRRTKKSIFDARKKSSLRLDKLKLDNSLSR